MQNQVKNSYTLRIIGIAELPNPLIMGFDYEIKAKVAIPKIEKIDLENGEFEYLHKAKMINIELATQGNKAVKGTAKGSKSQKLRWRILERTDNDGYEKIMDAIINNLDEVLNILKI